MLELIFQGFIEWVYGLILEFWQYFSSALLDIMGMDFAYLRTHMPIIDTIMEGLLAVGWALLIGNLVFQAVKSMMSGLGFEGEDPKLLFARTLVFAFLLLASPQICELCLNFTARAIDWMQVPDAVNITFADEASFIGLRGAWLLVIICGVIVMFQSIKLIFEMAERYLILAVLTITAPLAFSMGGSRNTSDIFTGWCRMYGSMCLLMVFHVVFIKMLFSVLSFYPSGLDVLPWMVLVISVVKVAKKIDGIITRIGLNPAITGDPLGRTFPGALSYMVVRAASSQVSKAFGKSSGGNERSRTSSSPPAGAGGPRGPGPAGNPQASSAPGGNGNESPSTGASHTYTEQGDQQSTVRQSSDVHSDARQGVLYQGTGQSERRQSGDVSASEQRGATAAQSAGTNPAEDKRKSAAVRGGSSRRCRNTAVPPGARRAPSRINAETTVVSGAAAAGKSAVSGESLRPGSDKGTSSSRPRQITSQQILGGATGSTVHAMEQNHISVGAKDQGRTCQPAKDPPSGMPSGKTPSRVGGAASSEADARKSGRSTRRPPAEDGERGYRSRVSAAPPSDAAGTPKARTDSHISAQESRSGRNRPPAASSSPPPGGVTRSKSARQEPREAAGGQGPAGKRQAASTIPGTAGTAPAGYRASQTRQTARKQSARAKSAPLAADTHGMKRTSSITSSQEKKASSRNIAPKPHKRPGGTGHG